MDEYIINNGKSYTGEFIKQWCEYHVNNDTKYSFIAKQLYYGYWREGNKYIPNPKAYYFIDRYRKYNNPIAESHLNRDIEKSPKVNNN